MLGFIFIYFIGKFFYQLAEKYNQNRWLYAVLGVVIYYGSGFLAGIIVAVFQLIFDFEVDWDNTILMTILALPVGISSCWLFHYLLERKWKNSVIKPIEAIEDIGKDSDEIGL